MSDLFSPMPLPARPVQRLADIAEREAAAKQKEIDTRLQESMETSRLQTLHEIGESKEEYRTTLEKLQQDYRREALSQPSRTYASGASSRGQSLSRASSASTDRVAYNLENARLSGQFNKAKLQLRIAADSFGRTWREEGWDQKTGWDNWQGIVEGIVGSLIYSQDENWSSVNTSFEIKMNQWVEKMGERVWSGWDDQKDQKLTYDLNAQNADTLLTAAMTFAQHSPPDDAMGLGRPYNLTPGWSDYEETFDGASSMIGVKSYRNTNSEPWRIMKNSFIERLGNGVVVEIQASIKAAQANPEMHEWSLSQHMDGALAKAQESLFYKSVKGHWSIDEDDVRDNFRSKVAVLINNNKMENAEGLADMFANGLAGNHADMDLVEYQYLAMSWGVPIEKAWRWAQDLAKDQQDRRWDSEDAIAKAAKKLRSDNVALFSSNLGEAIRTNPAWLDNIDDSRVELQRLEAVRFLDPGGSEYYEKYLKAGAVALLNQYDDSRGVINDFTMAVGQDARVVDRGGFTNMVPGEPVMSVDTLNAFLHRELDRMILDGEDGDRLTPGSMLEHWKRTVTQITGKMELKKNTREIITGISTAPGGEAQPMTAYQVKALPGVEAIFARSVLDLAGVDEAGMDEYDAMDPERRSGWAINQIPLASYKGTADDDSVHTENEATLHAYMSAGTIRAYRLDRANGEVQIQLADNGEWHFRQLDDRAAVEARFDLSKELYEAMDIEAGLYAGVNSGNVGLTHEVPNAFDRTVWEGPTIGAEVLERTVNNLTRSVVNFAKGLTTINWEEMGAMLRKQDIHGEAWGYTGLRPWQME